MQIVMNKPVYLELSILELSKISMHVLVWLGKTKIWWKSKILLYRYRLFIVYIKRDDIYVDIAEDVETRFDTSNYELDGPLEK